MFRAALRSAFGSDTRKPRNAKQHRLGLERLEDRMLLTLLGNPLFPADSPWNQKISNAPVAANSDTLVTSIGATSHLHPDFGTTYAGALIGIPYNVVSTSQPKVNVVVDAYAGESDLLPVPIPNGAIIEGDPLPSSQNNSDRHLLVYDKDQNLVYELFNAHRPTETQDHNWHADSEAVWDLSKDSFRTAGFTSADAAGLPILPGLVRPDEVLDQGVINHALRFTVPRSRNSYVFPASHQAGVNDSTLPRMGERFRLKQSFDISGYSATDRVILQTLKDYGMIVADNGSGWYLSGEPSTRWNDDDLHTLTQLLGSNFEAVNLTPIVSGLNQVSGPTTGGTAVTVQGKDFSGAAGQLKVFFGATPAASVSIVSDTTLIATSPAHSAGNVDVTIQTPYGTSTISTSDRFSFTATTNSTVQGRSLFYANSFFSSATNNPSFSDDTAIALDKFAYRPGGGTSTFANVSTYSQGINGIMVDLSIGGNHGAVATNVQSDFTFRVSGQFASNSPSSWTTLSGANLPAVTVRLGAGTGGSDRIELLWPSGKIVGTWLEVILKANADSGLTSDDVFYFGSIPGDSGQGNDPAAAFTDATDEIAARNHQESDLFLHYPLSVAIANPYDYNRDDQVDATDQIHARNFGKTNGELDMINISLSGPFAPATGDFAGGATASSLNPIVGSEAAVASALTTTFERNSLNLPTDLSSRLVNRLSIGEARDGQTADHINRSTQEEIPARRTTLARTSQNATSSTIDQELIDWVFRDLGLKN